MTRIDSNPVFQSEKIGKKVHNNKVPRQKCGLLANTELEIASPAMGHRHPAGISLTELTGLKTKIDFYVNIGFVEGAVNCTTYTALQ